MTKVKEVKEKLVVPQPIIDKSEAILRIHRMDYKVAMLPSYVKHEFIVDGEPFTREIKSPDFGLLNLKTMQVLNQVKEGYYVSQNSEVMEMVLMGLEGFDGLRITKCADLFGGRKIFIQIAIEGDTLLPRPDGKYDRITRYITIIDSKDGSTKLSVGIGDSTASCDNQFWQFYKQGNAKFLHSSSLEQKMEEIPNLIQYALLRSVRMGELYEEFVSTPVSRELAMDAMAEQLLGYNAKYDDITPRAMSNMNKLYGEMKSEMIDKGDNLWGLHSGVTKWTTHSKAAPNRPMGREESAMSGTNYKVNQKSLDFVTMLLDEMKKEESGAELVIH
jgi:hypothetical protein